MARGVTAWRGLSNWLAVCCCGEATRHAREEEARAWASAHVVEASSSIDHVVDIACEAPDRNARCTCCGTPLGPTGYALGLCAVCRGVAVNVYQCACGRWLRS